MNLFFVCMSVVWLFFKCILMMMSWVFRCWSKFDRNICVFCLVNRNIFFIWRKKIVFFFICLIFWLSVWLDWLWKYRNILRWNRGICWVLVYCIGMIRGFILLLLLLLIGRVSRNFGSWLIFFLGWLGFIWFLFFLLFVGMFGECFFFWLLWLRKWKLWILWICMFVWSFCLIRILRMNWVVLWRFLIKCLVGWKYLWKCSVILLFMFFISLIFFWWLFLGK